MRLMMTAALAAALPLAAGAATLSKVDKHFLHAAAIGNMTEVAEAQNALKVASGADVKKFADAMASAHQAAEDDLSKLAASVGYTLPAALGKKQAAQLAAEEKATGASFDQTYVADQIANHEGMQKVVQREIDHGSNADVKALASKMAPVVADHLKMVQALKAG